MPIELADVLKKEPAPPPGGPAPASSPTEPGLSISDVFAKQPQPKPIVQKVSDAVKPVVKGIAQKAAPVQAQGRAVLGEALTATLKPFWDDYTEMAQNFHAALEQDAQNIPEGTVGHLLDLGKKFNDLAGYYASPIIAPAYTGVIKPLQALVDKGTNFIKSKVSEANYDAQKQREGIPYPKGAKGFGFNQADVEFAGNFVKDVIEAGVNAGLSFIGPKGVERPLERPTATARMALQDAKSALAPPEPKLTPVSASLDKTMGFQKIADTVGKELSALPAGSTRTSAAIIDAMLPHAEGYAKSYITKLAEHVDPSVPVSFKTVAGRNRDYAGVYIPDYHKIEIKAGSSDMVHTTLHEIVHSATVNMLDTLLEADLKAEEAALGRKLEPGDKLRVLNNPRSPVIKELDAIIKEARVRAEKAGKERDREIMYALYGASYIQPSLEIGTPDRQPGVRDIAFARMSPRYEFTAEILNNPRLQEFLANSEKYASAGYKFKNMLNQFTLLIGRHLGMKGQEMQLLAQSMRVGTQLIKMQSAEKPLSRRSLMQIIGKVDGETITRGDIDRATVIGAIDSAGLRRAKTALQISTEQVLRAISPESLGRNAKLAAAVIASRITEQMRADSMWRYGSRTRLKFWRARPDFTTEFIERFEKGEKFSDPALQKLANKYKSWRESIYQHDTKMGFKYDPRENYLPHIFEDNEGVASYFTQKYGSKWGDPGFIKDRSFDLYKEAIAAGFRPRFDNPEDIMLARQHASDIATMHINIMNDLASYGLATRKILAREELTKKVGPDGKVSFEIVKTEGTKRPEGSIRWRAPNGDVFWVDPQADAILQNAFKSKSLWEDRGAGGTIFRGAMALKNTLIPIRLALSLFHPMHVLGIDASAGMARAMTGMLSGTTPIHKGLAEMLASGSMYRPISELPGLSRITKPLGWRVMQAWKGKIPPEGLTPVDADALKTLTEMGVVPEMSDRFRTNARQNFANAVQDAMADFRRGRPLSATGDTLRATWHAPWALISAMSKPLFEDWIPQLKAASALRDAKNLMDRNPELAENDAARHIAMRKLGKSVENRYGEMNYTTSLFWKRWVKDLAVLDTLSLGWQMGFIREYGGGALDLGQWAKSGDKLEQIRKGQLDRAIFVGAYTTLGAGVGGLMTWAFTGKPPESLLDYVAPRTGEDNPDGTPKRLNTMFYQREFASLYKHMQNEGAVSGLSDLVMNKGSGLIGLMHEWATGLNSFGQEIRNPEAPAYQKLEQTLAYTLSDLEPISMKAIRDNTTEDPVKSGTLTVLGFTPAPKYLTESKTDASIKMAFRNYVAPKETPFERAEYSKDYTQLREAYQTGSEKYGEMLDKMVDQFQLSGADQRRLIRSLNSTLPATTRMFMRLPWQEQIKVLDKATPDEVNQLLPHANKEHVRGRWVPPE